MAQYKAVIFDCDGVLLDSEVIYLKSLQHYLKDIGIEVLIEDLVFVVGMKTRDIAHALKDRFNITNTSVEEIDIMQDRYLANAMRELKLEPMKNLLPFLEKLKEREIKVAVASSSVRSYVEDVVDRIGIKHYIDLMVCGDDVVNSKPHPEIFNKTVETLAYRKEACLIIEDSVNGIKAANSAGIDVVAYKGSKIIQDTHEACFEADDFMEIKLTY